ncbi:MAG: ribonuclease HII [Helicobacteraceae bacterium]|nr:ribonuclease HII [Helicobacteraceae bacterium]
MNGNLCGIDEAGRGCLAGHLAIAGAVFNKTLNFDKSLLKDSKKLNEKSREELAKVIMENSVFHIEIFEPIDIDNFGLSECIKKGLTAIKNNIKSEKYLYDGNTNFGIKNIDTLIKADSKISEVSAASILAKTARDNIFLKSAQSLAINNYNFENNKGYGTEDHFEAIFWRGVTPLHRKSFALYGSSYENKKNSNTFNLFSARKDIKNLDDLAVNIAEFSNKIAQILISWKTSDQNIYELYKDAEKNIAAIKNNGEICEIWSIFKQNIIKNIPKMNEKDRFLAFSLAENAKNLQKIAPKLKPLADQ